MTQEEMCGKVLDTLQVSDVPLERRDDDDCSSVCSERAAGVRDIIMRFERGLPAPGDEDRDSRDSDPSDGIRTPNFINPMNNHLSALFLNAPNSRTSITSVNSILSGVSETSFGSGSSAMSSDRRSDADYRLPLTPIRPAPPPPQQFADTDSSRSRSSILDDDDQNIKFAFTPPLHSPVLLRRARQPPVMRRKSLAESQKDLGVHWSYGVTQSELEKLLRIRRRITDCQNANSNPNSRRGSQESTTGSEAGNEDGDSRDSNDSGPQEEDAGADAVSTDRSTDTLIDGDPDDCDSLAAASDTSGQHSVIGDNISIRSVSSLDMVPYQKYDSITVSSDEFGSEVCHEPDNEFLSVSAVNEWCVSKSAGAVVIPVESKKEKYKRRLTERVNELIHTESLYVEKLRHVVEDYIPELERADAPPALRALRFDIFANIDKMHRFHADHFLPDLRAAEHDLRKLGRCFRRYEQKFNMYVIYSRNNKRATRLVYEYKHFFQQKQIELGERLDLSSYLLEPVQRIPRYKLFLDDLVKTYMNYENEQGETESLRSKASLESNDTGCSNGDSAEGDETILQSLRLAKVMVETLLVTVDDIIALENIRDCPINLLNQGKLLRQHEFLVTDPTRRRHHMRVFLFEKIVLLTAVYKKQLTVEIFLYRDHIPVDELGITPKEHDTLKFTVWYRKRNIKNYKLETTEPSVRSAWVQDITALLWKQAMTTKEKVMQSRSARNSVISVTSQQSSEGDPESPPGDKYNSLRGVPGEVRRAREKTTGSRRTTWYYE